MVLLPEIATAGTCEGAMLLLLEGLEVVEDDDELVADGLCFSKKSVGRVARSTSCTVQIQQKIMLVQMSANTHKNGLSTVSLSTTFSKLPKNKTNYCL